MPTKVLEVCESKIQFSKAHHAESKEVQDITQASVAQLARLMAEILRLHLASRHLSTTGTKATMAQRLYDAIHAPDAPAQQHSVDSVAATARRFATNKMTQYLSSSKACSNSKACYSKTRSSSAKPIPLLLQCCNSTPTSRL